MTIQTRVSQDRRDTSRVMAGLDCHFNYEGVSQNAVMVNLSLKGAFLSAKALPPNGAIITVVMSPPAVKKEILFSGTVTRGTWASSEQGKISRFGIRFGSLPLDLIVLINSLNSR
jgi:hypothetical protein